MKGKHAKDIIFFTKHRKCSFEIATLSQVFLASVKLFYTVSYGWFYCVFKLHLMPPERRGRFGNGVHAVFL